MSDDPFLSLPGAVVADGAVQHYGAPLAEQRSLDAGNAAVSLSHRGIVQVWGEDRLTWLNSMTSQALSGLQPGESVETLLLDPQGRIEHAVRVVDDGQCAWLLVDEGHAGPLAEYLNRMRFALRVEVREVSDRYGAVLVFDGGGALPVLRGLGSAEVEWRDPWSSVLPGGVQYAKHSADHPGANWSAVQLVFRREDLGAVASLVSTGKIRAAGMLALDALEVRAWRPSQHGDLDDRSLPHEFDWLRTAVHLNKGCYRGQETVAKVHNLGHPPRRLALLHLDGSGGELPGPGALVYAAGAEPASRPLGRVTRSALHYEWGGIALALLKRATPEDALLEVALGETGEERIAATQETIVPPDAGATREIPRLKRL